MPPLVLNNSCFGKGVFANKHFSKGDILIECKAPLLHSDEVPDIITTPEDDRYLQVGPETFQGPSGDMDDYVNHSCDPNAGLKFQGGHVYLVAIKRIKQGDEITFDYSTTMDDPHGWEMECRCGAPSCRGRIRDFKHLPKQLQQKYIRLGIVPDYCIKAMRQEENMKPRVVVSIPRF